MLNEDSIGSTANTTNYNAHAFHESLNNGRSSGTLALSRDGFKFIVDNQLKVHFPLPGTQLKLGGASDRLIFLRHGKFPDWSFYTSDRSLLSHRGLNSIEELAAQIKPMRNKRFFNWCVFAVIFLLILLLPTLFLVNMDSVSAIVVRQIPTDWETQLGESAYAQYRIQHDILEQDEAKQSLTELTTVLTEHLDDSHYTFKFHIVNDPSLNAFALPGGTIVIHTGLIIRADSADELLGVLAHEISHVTEQHGLRSMVMSAGIIIVVQALLGDASGLMATIASAAPFLLNLQYSRNFETQADEKGFELLKAATINPQGLVQFFEKIIAEQEKIKEKIADENTAQLLDSLSGFLSTHPATQERIDHIKVLAGSNTVTYRNMNQVFYRLKTQIEAFVTDTKKEDDNENKH